jgi:hypothetical protein
MGAGMSRRETQRSGTKAEMALAAAVSSVLAGRSVGESVDLLPDSDVCGALERFVPEVLRGSHAGWAGESLDGVFVTHATKVGEGRLRLLGTAILLSDQSVTPLWAELEVSPSAQGVAAGHVKVGESGGGPLGISVAPYQSEKAFKLQYGLADRVASGRVAWVYGVRWEVDA